jgi:gluconate 5-dehydrogenase
MNVLELFSLEGKVAVVTGGAGHLGSAMTDGLTEAGAKVVVFARSREKYDFKYHNRTDVAFFEGDIGSTESVQSCYRYAVEQFGHIDILVNDAVFLKGGGKLPEDIDDDILSYSSDGIFASSYRCIREVIPYMEGRGGKIVNIASMYGVVAPNLSMYSDVCSAYLNPIHYGALKAAVLQMTKYFGAYLIQKGINVNAVTPGTYPSPKVQQNEEFVRRLSEKNPAGRIGVPEDLKGAVVYLSSKASDYVVGQNIIVDGGWTLW